MALTSLFPAQGLQNFVDESSNLLTAINGSPGAGQFRSSVVGRAPIADPSQDLRPRMAIDRVMTQFVYPVQNEYGTNGERIWAFVGDDRGIFRGIGIWGTSFDNYGTYIFSGTVNDYAEFTFFGTGLNVLWTGDGNARDWRATVDGGSESANLQSGTVSGVRPSLL